MGYYPNELKANKDATNGSSVCFVRYEIQIWMASCTSWLTHIKKTTKMYVIDSHNLINIRVSHSGLDYLVTDFVNFLC